MALGPFELLGSMKGFDGLVFLVGAAGDFLQFYQSD